MRLKEWRETVLEAKIQKAQNDPKFHHRERRMSQIVRRISTRKNIGCVEHVCNSKIVFDPLKHINFLKLPPEENEKWERFLELDQLTWFIEVAHLKTGNTFGELALINDKPRAASIKAISQCYFATIKK